MTSAREEARPLPSETQEFASWLLDFLDTFVQDISEANGQDETPQETRWYFTERETKDLKDVLGSFLRSYLSPREQCNSTLTPSQRLSKAISQIIPPGLQSDQQDPVSLVHHVPPSETRSSFGDERPDEPDEPEIENLGSWLLRKIPRVSPPRASYEERLSRLISTYVPVSRRIAFNAMRSYGRESAENGSQLGASPNNSPQKRKRGADLEDVEVSITPTDAYCYKAASEGQGEASTRQEKAGQLSLKAGDYRIEILGDAPLQEPYFWWGTAVVDSINVVRKSVSRLRQIATDLQAFQRDERGVEILFNMVAVKQEPLPEKRRNDENILISIAGQMKRMMLAYMFEHRIDFWGTELFYFNNTRVDFREQHRYIYGAEELCKLPYVFLWRELKKDDERGLLSKEEYDQYYTEATDVIRGCTRWTMIYSRFGWAGVFFFHWISYTAAKNNRYNEWDIYLGILEEEVQWLTSKVRGKLGPSAKSLFEVKEPPDLDDLIKILDQM